MYRFQLASGLALAGGAFAQDAAQVFYAGVSLGEARFPDACSSNAGVSLGNCNDTNTTWKIYGGHPFSPNFAWEVGYNDFGHVSSDALASLGGSTFTGNARFEASAWELSAIGSLPLASPLSIYGRLGAYYARTKSDVNLTNARSSATNHNSNFTFGLGARYDLAKTSACAPSGSASRGSAPTPPARATSTSSRSARCTASNRGQAPISRLIGA